MLKVNKLSKKIHNKIIFNEINFEVTYGQIVIFLGGSGVGKSTLLRILSNLESYDSGTFFLDDTPLNLTTVNRNHTVGMIFQHGNLFEHLTVEDNIISTLIHCKGFEKKRATEVSQSLLARYELGEQAKASIHQLSGGQKQRVAIARTLAIEPKVICFDEPTSALDPRLTQQVAKCISELAADHRIIILTTHDMHLLEHLEGNILLLEDGAISERALKSKYTENPNLYPKIHRFLQGF